MTGIAMAVVDVAVCMDWCCHYGSNRLFKFEFCWITYEVDYMNQNRTFTKRMEITKTKKNALRIRLILGYQSHITKTVQRQFLCKYMYKLSLCLLLSPSLSIAKLFPFSPATVLLFFLIGWNFFFLAKLP